MERTRRALFVSEVPHDAYSIQHYSAAPPDFTFHQPSTDPDESDSPTNKKSDNVVVAASPPAIPRRWLPPNAEAPKALSQSLARLLGQPHTDTPHADTLHTADLINHRALVLLGESGAGKSYELSELKRMEAPLCAPLSLDFGAFTAPLDLRDRLIQFCQQHVTERQTLYLDALDEDKTEGQRLGDELAATLESLTLAERTNLRIRLTSRTASWPAALGHRLTTLLGLEAPLKVLMLQPLSEDEAALIAATFYSDAAPEEAAERGRAEVARARRLDMQALTMSPLTLKLLCAANLQKDTIVTRAQLFERGIQRLLKEPRPGLAPDRQELKRKEALEHAAWFAALSTLAGRSPIPLDDWPTGLDMDALAERLNKDTSTLRRVLTTPLFDDAPGTVCAARRFVHQSFAEGLAARWIITHGSVERWAERLMPKGSAVPAQVLGVASWLVCMDDRWMEHVIGIDAAIVVTPSLPLESVERRLQVFQSLISAARSGALNDHYWRLANQNAALTLNGAEREVVEAIDTLVPQEAHTVGTLVCLVAMSTLIHRDAGRTESIGGTMIVDALVRLALDHDRRGYKLAERAVSVLKTGLTVSPERAALPRTTESRWWDAHVRPLRALLSDPKKRPDLPADDEADRAARLAYTLDLLFPRVITAKEFVDALHQPRGHVIGHFNTFLHYELPLLAQDHPALIPPLLQWWTQQSERDIEWDDHRETPSAWRASWSHRAEPKIWSVLVEAFYKLLIKHSTPKRFDLNQHDRRLLLHALWTLHHNQSSDVQPLTTRIATHDWGLSPDERLLQRADLDWWVQLFIDGSDRMREEIVTVIANNIGRNDAEALLQLLRAVNEQAPDAKRVLREGLKVYIELAEVYERGEVPPAPPPFVDEAHEEKRRQWAIEAEERRARMIAALQPLEGPHKAWWALCNGLMHHAYYTSAVPKDEFWTSISESETAQAMDRAREYLEAPFDFHPDDHAVVHDKWYYTSEFAVAAILVLAKFCPSEDLGLSVQAWERWALTVVAERVPSPVLDQLGAARARVEPLPNTALRRVFKELESTTNKEAAEHLARLAQHGEPQALAAALREALASGLSAEAEAVMLERYASRNDPAGEVARDAARERLRAGREANGARWQKAGLALWLSQHITEADKELLLVWLDDKESLQLLKAHNYWAPALSPLSQLSPAQLVRLYKRTHHHFPPPLPTPEPPVGEGSGAIWVSAGDDPSSLLSSILYRLNEETTPEAADALDELGRDYNNADLIQRAALMRRELQRANWQPPSIEDLLSFAVGAKPHKV